MIPANNPYDAALAAITEIRDQMAHWASEIERLRNERYGIGQPAQYTADDEHDYMYIVGDAITVAHLVACVWYEHYTPNAPISQRGRAVTDD